MRKIAQAITDRKMALSVPRKLSFVFAAFLGALVLLGGTAYGVVVKQSGSETTKQYFASDSDPFTTQTVGSWQNVTNAWVAVAVPSTRIVDARFTAESLCTGTAGWCSVRIVLINNATLVVSELHPGAGTDYKFDTPGGAEEAGALERTSGLIAAGNYTVRVQALRLAGVTQFTLDDQQLTVGLVNP